MLTYPSNAGWFFLIMFSRMSHDYVRLWLNNKEYINEQIPTLTAQIENSVYVETIIVSENSSILMNNSDDIKLVVNHMKQDKVTLRHVGLGSIYSFVQVYNILWTLVICYLYKLQEDRLAELAGAGAKLPLWNKPSLCDSRRCFSRNMVILFPCYIKKSLLGCV